MCIATSLPTASCPSNSTITPIFTPCTYWAMRAAVCRRSKRRTVMFSPIFCTSAWRVSSTVLPPMESAGERGHVGRVGGGHQLRQRLREGGEIRVLRDEVGLAVHLDHRAELAVGGDVDAHGALRGHAGGRLGGLGAALDAQQLLGLLHVAARFLERLLALHHAEPGELAQVLDHARGDVRHIHRSNRITDAKRGLGAPSYAG